MGKSNLLGAWGERQAAAYLVSRGFSIVDKNVHSRYGEIDIIAQKDGFLVFVEVKLRKNDRFGTPAAAVTKKKQEKLRMTALQYLQEHETTLQPRFDVIELYAPKGVETNPVPIRQLENAF